MPGAGDIWLWVAIDADTKVVPCVMLGGRNSSDAQASRQPHQGAIVVGFPIASVSLPA